jgi:hypothetical protein
VVRCVEKETPLGYGRGLQVFDAMLQWSDDRESSPAASGCDGTRCARVGLRALPKVKKGRHWPGIPTHRRRRGSTRRARNRAKLGGAAGLAIAGEATREWARGCACAQGRSGARASRADRFSRRQGSELAVSRVPVRSGSRWLKACLWSCSPSACVRERTCDNPPRKIPYYRLNQPTLVIKQ